MRNNAIDLLIYVLEEEYKNQINDNTPLLGDKLLESIIQIREMRKEIDQIVYDYIPF